MEGHVRLAQLFNGHGQGAQLVIKFVLGRRLDTVVKKDSSPNRARKALHWEREDERKSIDNELHNDVSLLSFLFRL
jgi:hypothetical protein